MTVTASVSTAPFSRRDARRYRSRIVARYSCLACGPTRVPSWGTPVWVWPLVKTLVLLLTVSGLAQQACAPQRLAAARAALLDEFQSQRKSRVIAMIHRQETVSLLGVPVSSSIDIQDSEAVLRTIRLTPADRPIDLILHTPGGLVLAAEQIAHGLALHQGKVTVFVPHYAMSGGTLLALTADEIVKVLSLKPPASISDEMLVLADVAQKARVQVASFVAEVLLKHLPKDRAAALATTLSEGRWTHDFPITVEAAKELGLPISTEMPPLTYALMDLYPQSGVGRLSVMYVPLRRTPAALVRQDEGRQQPSPR